MAQQLKTNHEIVSDKAKNPVTNSEYIKHGNKWLNDAVNEATAEVAKKANKDYVDAELAKKANAADLTALETTVSGKADSSTVAGISDRVTQNTTKTVDLQSQIDNLVIEAGGDSNPEVVQARTDAAGTTHATLKGRIDSEVTDLKSDLNEHINFAYEYGTIADDTGVDVDSATIIRTKGDGFKGFGKAFLSVSKGVLVTVFVYNSYEHSWDFSFSHCEALRKSQIYNFLENKYYKLIFEKENENYDVTITLENINEIFKAYRYTNAFAYISQYEPIKKEIDNKFILDFGGYESGSVDDNTGYKADSPVGVRSKLLFEEVGKMFLKLSDNALVHIDKYSNYLTDTNFTYVGRTTVYESSDYIFESGYSYRFSVYHKDSSPMHIDDTEAFAIIHALSEVYKNQSGSSSSEDKNALTGIIIDGEVVEKDASRHSVIPRATVTSTGLMSKEDKQKLANIIPSGTINISGSGVTKNASAFGFLPTNDASTNVRNLQSCLNGGGTILVDVPGIYQLDSTVFIDDNTTIVFGANVYLKAVRKSDGTRAKYTLVNRGAITREYNENISIFNLKLIPVSGASAIDDFDIDGIVGLQGAVSFFYIKNLLIDGYELIDHSYFSYALQICTFENVVCKNLHFELSKDGIHYGRGKHFVLKDCIFLTNDDAIALNAIDYSTSNAEVGDIEDGIVENITFLNGDGLGYGQKRAMLILSGAWDDWSSGERYQTRGDYCVNNGILYVTNGEAGQSASNYIVSTHAPTHTNGSVTYADGLTWLAKQPCLTHSANINNVVFRDFYIYRKVENVALISSEYSAYCVSVHTESNLKENKNLTFENINLLYDGDVTANTFIDIQNPVDNIKIINCNFNKIDKSIIRYVEVKDVDISSNVRIAMIGNYYDFDGEIVKMSSYTGSLPYRKPNVKINIVGSLTGDDYAFKQSTDVISPTFVNNDLI